MGDRPRWKRPTADGLAAIRGKLERGEYVREDDYDDVADCIAEIDALTAERDRWARAAGTAMGAEVLAEDCAATAEAGVAVSETIRRHDVAEIDRLTAERDALRERLDALEAAYDSRGHTGQWEAMHAAKLRAATERADAAERERDTLRARIRVLEAEMESTAELSRYLSEGDGRIWGCMAGEHAASEVLKLLREMEWYVPKRRSHE